MLGLVKGAPVIVYCLTETGKNGLGIPKLAVIGTVYIYAWWFSARKMQLQCISNGVTSFLHKTSDVLMAVEIP